MDSGELIELIGAGPNAVLVAALGGDASWHVAEDWGLGSQWQAVRVPVGIKFRRSANGLVREEVVIARAMPKPRLTHEKLLALSRIPTRLVVVSGPRDRSPHVGRDN